MATLFSTADTGNLTLTADTWVSLVGGAHTVTGLGTMVTVTGYAYNLDYAEVALRIVIDSTEAVSSASPTIMVNKVLSIGSHTIDIQAISLNTSRTANTRGSLATTL